LIDQIIATASFGEVVLRFDVNIFGNGREAISIVERHFRVEWGLDLRVNAPVREAKSIEIEVLREGTIQNTALNLPVLGLKVCHGAWSPVTTILIRINLVHEREVIALPNLPRR
jgi:hypothetical protein